jgi:hypothetical protein
MVSLYLLLAPEFLQVLVEEPQEAEELHYENAHIK